MKKKYEIIEKHDVMTCWKCNGQGSLSNTDCEGEGNYCYEHEQFLDKNNDCRVQCSTCNGTGKWEEKHYIIIDNKNKIAFDSDNIG